MGSLLLARSVSRQVLTEEILAKTYLSPANSGLAAMASMIACDCGWTLVSPSGDADVKKHAKMHVADAHPGTTMTEEQLTGIIKQNLDLFSSKGLFPFFSNLPKISETS